MSFTSELTIVPNATPIIMPTAMSTTLPRMMNSLKSFSISFLSFLVVLGNRLSKLYHRIESNGKIGRYSSG